MFVWFVCLFDCVFVGVFVCLGFACLCFFLVAASRCVCGCLSVGLIACLLDFLCLVGLLLYLLADLFVCLFAGAFHDRLFCLTFVNWKASFVSCLLARSFECM